MSRNDVKRNAAFEVFFICIRIRIGDPNPGGQKLPRKIEKVNKFHLLKCWRMFSLFFF